MPIFSNLFSHKRNIDELSLRLGLPKNDLSLWQSGIPSIYNYFQFQIPKKKKGDYRNINAPNEALCKLQKLVYRKLLKKIKVHHSTKGFVPKTSIVHNALVHLQQEVVINLDLKDFFDNTSSRKVLQFWQNIGWDKQTATILCNICSLDGKLPQGAPTSPMLSNLVNFRMDCRISNLISHFGGIYTRYADDITISFAQYDSVQRGLLKIICKIIKENGYQLNKKKKIRIQRPHQRQTVTGLVVNRKVNLLRLVRHRIRAMQHYQKLGKLQKNDENKLKGWLSLQEMIIKQSDGYQIIPKIYQTKSKTNHQKSTVNNTKYVNRKAKSFRYGLVIYLIIFITSVFIRRYNNLHKDKLINEIKPTVQDLTTCPIQFGCQKMQMDINALLTKANTENIDTKLNAYRRWTIALGAILTEQNKLPHDQFDFSNKIYYSQQLKTGLKTMLADSWGITDRQSMIDTFSWLVNIGHSREDYLPIYKYIQYYPGKSVQDLSQVFQGSENLSGEEKIKNYKNILYLKDKQALNNNLVYAWDYGRFVFLVRAAYHVGYLNQKEAIVLIDEAGEKIKDRFNSWTEFGENYALGRVLWGMNQTEIVNNTQEIYQNMLDVNGQWAKISWEWSEGK